jgi:hypothetical protein
MDITQEIIIDQPIEKCWAVLGEQYTEIYKWASPVNHSEGDNQVGINGANCDIRGCNVSGMGDITEKLIAFNPKEHYLAYQIIKGLPNMLESGKNSWRLTSISEHRTRLYMHATIVPKGFFGKLMKPMIKMQFNQMAKHLTEEFKYYLEKGEPHPRKIKAALKFAV